MTAMMHPLLDPPPRTRAVRDARRERCPYCREAYVRKPGEWRNQVHQCKGERCPKHIKRDTDGYYRNWPRYNGDCQRCAFAQTNQNNRMKMYDGRGRPRRPCRRCGNIGGFHRPGGWTCTYIQMCARNHAPVGRYWQVLGGVPTGTVGYGTAWWTKAQVTAPCWATLIAGAVHEWPSACERRALIRWAQSCSEGRQTLLRALVHSRLTIRALQGDDVSDEVGWIAQ